MSSQDTKIEEKLEEVKQIIKPLGYRLSKITEPKEKAPRPAPLKLAVLRKKAGSNTLVVVKNPSKEIETDKNFMTKNDREIKVLIKLGLLVLPDEEGQDE